jgi:hypothetical protein
MTSGLLLAPLMGSYKEKDFLLSAVYCLLDRRQCIVSSSKISKRTSPHQHDSKHEVDDDKGIVTIQESLGIQAVHLTVHVSRSTFPSQSTTTLHNHKKKTQEKEGFPVPQLPETKVQFQDPQKSTTHHDVCHTDQPLQVLPPTPAPSSSAPALATQSPPSAVAFREGISWIRGIARLVARRGRRWRRKGRGVRLRVGGVSGQFGDGGRWG